MATPSLGPPFSLRVWCMLAFASPRRATRSSRLAAGRSQKTTCAPSSTNRSTVARPMPEAPPVMTATLPSRRPISSSPSTLEAGVQRPDVARRGAKHVESRRRRDPDVGPRRHRSVVPEDVDATPLHDLERWWPVDEPRLRRTSLAADEHAVTGIGHAGLSLRPRRSLPDRYRRYMSAWNGMGVG